MANNLFLVGYVDDPIHGPKKIRVAAGNIGGGSGGSGGTVTNNTIIQQKIISQINIHQGFFELMHTVDVETLDEELGKGMTLLLGGINSTYGVDYTTDISDSKSRIVWGSQHPSAIYTDLMPLHYTIRVGDVAVVIYNKV